MDFATLITRPAPQPWEHDKIPWTDPAFSARMLKEHLDQSHDAASRRFDVIDRQVTWLATNIIGRTPSRILDIGCGPGFYTSRLADLGHDCRGIDYSPAAIDYARERASAHEEYIYSDVRTVDFGEGWDIVMMWSGELNVFRPVEARDIVARAARALAPGGSLLLEVSTSEAITRIGTAPATWRTLESGLFLDAPHLLLKDSRWYPGQRASTVRYTTLAADSSVTEFSETFVAHSPGELDSLLSNVGLTSSPIGATPPAWQHSTDFVFIHARRH